MESRDMYLADRLYNLKLGEFMAFDAYEVVRVPGGWLFRRYVDHYDPDKSPKTDYTVFVPFNNEFQTPR